VKAALTFASSLIAAFLIWFVTGETPKGSWDLWPESAPKTELASANPGALGTVGVPPGAEVHIFIGESARIFVFLLTLPLPAGVRKG
jgi:hypothetical protein